MDKYGYIGIETLLVFCENSKDHAVTPNDFMRMERVRIPEQKRGHLVQVMGKYDWMYRCSECDYIPIEAADLNFCPHCGAKLRELEKENT